MQSYYGGRAECRIKGIKVPIMFVDFTSQYATCNSLLGTWGYMIARDVNVQDDTEEVRKFLNSVTFQKMFNRASWPDLNFFALVGPHGDMVRAVYNDVEGERTNIGINPLTSKVPIWYSGPDLAASKIQTGRSPKIVKAVRITPVGVQDGLDSSPSLLEIRRSFQRKITSTTSWSKGRSNRQAQSSSFINAWQVQAAMDWRLKSTERSRLRKTEKRSACFRVRWNSTLSPNPKELRIRDRGSVLSQSSFY
jgi:hypothetical protein